MKSVLSPVPSQDKLGELQQEGHLVKKWRDEGGGPLISPDGVACNAIVCVSISDISPCTIKSRRRFLPAPAQPGSQSRKRAVKQLCVCVSPHSGVQQWIKTGCGAVVILPRLGQCFGSPSVI